MRKQFDQELVQLNNLLLEMAMLIENSLQKSTSLLDEKNEQVKEEVFAYERKIDMYEKAIQADCLKLFVSQQPAATDLRLISAALKMITDMQRIGVISRNIAEISMILPLKYATNSFPLIREMSDATIKLVNDAIKSFINLDLKEAEKIDIEDDVIDQYFRMIRNEIIDIIKVDVDGALAIDFIMIAKYLEKIADHAVNISKWVIFTIKG